MGDYPSPISRGSFSLFLVGLGILFVLPSCGDGGPTGLDLAELEIVIVQGDGQASEPGAVLPYPLQVRVQKVGNGAPVEGAKVQWKVLSGGGATLDPTSSPTDSLGLAETRFTVGPNLGPYTVQGSVKGEESVSVEFSVGGILVPDLTSVPAVPVAAGDTIPLGGVNFSQDAVENVVTFSGIRGKVVAASADRVEVEVPRCLLPRDYEVRVSVGALTTESTSLSVAGAPVTLNLSPGEDVIVDASEGFGCLHLPDGPGGMYLVVPHSTGTVGGAVHGFSLTGLTGDGLTPGAPGPLLWTSGPPPGASPSRPDFAEDRRQLRSLEARDRWHERLRINEASLWAEERARVQAGTQAPPISTNPARPPKAGERRVFRVLNAEEKFDKVTARLRFISDHSLVYVDEDAPPGGFTDADLASLALEFENPIYPIVTEVFGFESDLDQNGRVIILLTSAVNRLTPPGSDGYVGGFFYGLDLLVGRTGSNEGEVFYAMVPDPEGRDGPAISRFSALNTIPSVLAHEFEHMVHFNQRMLLGGAESTEALWLSEALAQMAEDLVGEAFSHSYQVNKAYQYRAGNWIRATRFLEDPGQTSVLASLPPGNLAERGAGWLFLKHAYGRTLPANLLGALVRSTLTGAENVSAATGVPWPRLVADWAGSLYLDEIALPVRPDLRMAGVNLRLVLSAFEGYYPLEVRFFGEQSTAISGSLWSSAPNYFIINPPNGGGMALSAGGPGGGVPEVSMGFRFLVVRLR